MPRYEVDVKAFFSFEVEAPTPEAAQEVANAFIDNAMTAGHDMIEGYNGALPEDAIGTVVPSEIVAAIDGETDVTEVEVE